MIATNPALFVIFPNDANIAMLSSNSEFHIWLILQKLNKNNDFSEDSAINIYDKYKSDWKTEKFIDVQLKFYLIRQSQKNENELKDLILGWISDIHKQLPELDIYLTTFKLTFFSNLALSKYGKYYYSFDSLKWFVYHWKNSTIELKNWLYFKHLRLPEDFEFGKLLLKSDSEINLPVSHIRKLFNEYIDITFEKKFKPRLKNKPVVEKEKAILNRIMDNTASDSDQKYINKLFVNFYSWTTLSENMTKCQMNQLSISELDINSQFSFSSYFAILKYHAELNQPQKTKKQKPAIWFKSLPKENKSEVFDVLHDIYDIISVNCPKSKWADFKSVFGKNGTSVRIEWIGDASLLNYIFRKLNKALSYSGNKWEIISHYFYRGDANDKTLHPEKLKNNTHFNESENRNLVNRLNDLMFTLSI